MMCERRPAVDTGKGMFLFSFADVRLVSLQRQWTTSAKARVSDSSSQTPPIVVRPIGH